MIANKGYRDGIPANSKSVPDGAAKATIEWSRTTHASSGTGAVYADRLAKRGYKLSRKTAGPRYRTLTANAVGAK